MKSNLFTTFFALTIAFTNAQTKVDTLTNSQVIKLSNLGLQSSVIITKIQESYTIFDVSTDGLVNLNSNGVAAEVINEMIKSNSRAQTKYSTSKDIRDTIAKIFYVEKTSDGYEQPIIDQLILENYKVVSTKDSSGYTIKCIISSSGMGLAKGFVEIIESKTGKFLLKSAKSNGQRAIWNGYANPKMDVMRKIAKEYLIEMLRSIKK